jgi:ribose transport system ATP-binding protein
LTAQGVGIILLSDNLPELIGLSTRVILMKDGQIMAEIPCPPNAKPAEHELVRHIV